MRKNFLMAAAGVAVVLAGATAANAFQLEKKGTLAKWRTSEVKLTLKHTTCLLSAWQKCEAAAAKEGNGTQFADCNVLTAPASGGTSYNPSAKNASSGVLAAFDTAAGKCDAAVSSPGDPKKGLSASQPAGFNLVDIGCPGDCNTADGTQPCTDVVDYENNVINPVINQRKTAMIIGSSLGLLCSGDTTGVGIAALTGKAIKYIAGVSACQQKCQDDFASKAGDGFMDDTTNCIVGSSGQVAFNTCVSKAQAGSKLISDPAPAGCSAGIGTILAGLLDKTLNDSTNSSFDRIDLGTSWVVGVVSAGAPPLAPIVGSLSDREGASKRVSFGSSCPTFGDGLVQDYEECDLGATGNVLCGAIPGTKAGTCGSYSDPLSGVSPGRCPR